MNRIEALVLGLVQGLTEFLPVSSSGHLVLCQHLFGLVEPELLFDICLHVGTLLAVVVVFYKDLLGLLQTLGRLPALVRSAGGIGSLFARNTDFRLLVMIVMGSFPTAVLGLVFASLARQLFSTIWLVGAALLISGTCLWLTRHRKTAGRDIRQMRLRDAFFIGLVQGLAIIPGISRSGTTIAAALYLGVERELAARFSFLLAIPSILGALVIGLDGLAFRGTLPADTIVIGSLVAAVAGYTALVILLKIVKQGQLHRFAPYCWVVGALALIVSTV